MNQTESPFMRSPEVVAAAVGDKTFLLHVTNWVYLELNESGTRIWELLEDGRPLDRVVEDLCREFHVDRQVCARDVAELLETLEAKQFVTRG